MLVTDQNGVNVFLSEAALSKKVGAGLNDNAEDVRENPPLRRTAVGVIDSQPGIIRSDLFLGFKNNVFIVMDFSTCDWIDGPERFSLSDLSFSTYEKSFTVLPSTPPGTYTLKILNSSYCDSGPAKKFTIKVVE